MSSSANCCAVVVLWVSEVLALVGALNAMALPSAISLQIVLPRSTLEGLVGKVVQCWQVQWAPEAFWGNYYGPLDVHLGCTAALGVLVAMEKSDVQKTGFTAVELAC